MIIANVSLSGNNTKLTASSNMSEFVIFKQLMGRNKLTIGDVCFQIPLYMVPWNLRNWWINCIETTKSMNFFVTHIYRKGNTFADNLCANLNLALSSFVWFPS